MIFWFQILAWLDFVNISHRRTPISSITVEMQSACPKPILLERGPAVMAATM